MARSVKNLRTYLFILLSSALLHFESSAQSNATIDNAITDYQMGRWDSSLAKLNRYLHSAQKTTSSNKWAVYRLMTLNNFYLDSLDKARKSLGKMIGLNPYYVPDTLNNQDPSDFVLYYQNHKIRGYGVGVKLSTNFTLVHLLLSHPLNGSVTQSGSEIIYQSKARGNLAVFAERRLTNKIWYTQEAQLTMKTIDNIDPAFPGTLSLYSEDQVYFEIPASLRIELGAGKKNAREKEDRGEGQLKPYIRIGVCPGYMLLSRIKLGTNLQAADDPIDFTSHRKRFSIDPFIGLGAIMNTMSGKYALEVRYRQATANVVNVHNRYDDQTNIFNYLYTDNDFMLSSVEISLSFTRTSFSLKEKKNALFKFE